MSQTPEFTQLITEKKLYRIVELDYSGKKTGEEYVVLEATAGYLKVKFSCEAKEKTMELKTEPTTETFCQGRYSVTCYEEVRPSQSILFSR